MSTRVTDGHDDSPSHSRKKTCVCGGHQGKRGKVKRKRWSRARPRTAS